jgi:hypothetical protein
MLPAHGRARDEGRDGAEGEEDGVLHRSTITHERGLIFHLGAGRPAATGRFHLNDAADYPRPECPIPAAATAVPLFRLVPTPWTVSHTLSEPQ